MSFSANCWICEGWSSEKVKFIIGTSGHIHGYDPVNNPFFIHFEHEKFAPRLLNYVKEPVV